jgi:hypothetical protein
VRLAGEAKCRLLAVLGDQAPVELVLTETGGTAGFSKSVWQDWTIEFQVQPYPEIEKTIAAADYKLLMKVTR